MHDLIAAPEVDLPARVEAQRWRSLSSEEVF